MVNRCEHCVWLASVWFRTERLVMVDIENIEDRLKGALKDILNV